MNVTAFEDMALPAQPTVMAPDGSEVRVLLSRPGGSMAHFRLPPGATSHAVSHRTVEEIWYVVAGQGQMWRRQGDAESVIDLSAGICLTLPVGTHFQFKASADGALEAVAITMPPWPGMEEAVFVPGHWPGTRHNAAPGDLPATDA